MKINTLNKYSAAAKPGILSSLLLATALTVPSGQARAFPAESLDPAIHLPPDQAAQVTTEFLARNFANAFERALNSPGDTLTLKIEGEVEFPIPIPDMPPGLFNGGIQLAVTPEIKVVEGQGNSEPYYEVAFERAQGLSFGASLPDMPEGTDASGKVTVSSSTREVFRFSSPADAARGMMDYMLLQGLWQEMKTFESAGIDLSQVADFTRKVRSYFVDLTGVDFTLSRDDALKALNAARVSLQAAETGVAAASRSLEEAYKVFTAATAVQAAVQQKLADAQGKVNTARTALNACARFCLTKKAALTAANGALNVARNAAAKAGVALSAARTGVATAGDRLDQATAALDRASLAVTQAERQLALLPEDVSIDPFEIALTRLVEGVEFLNRSHQGTEVAFSRGVSVDAKAVCKAAAGATSARTIKLAVNDIDQTIAVAISAVNESSGQVSLPDWAEAAGVELGTRTGIEYELVFALGSETQRYELQDQGTLRIGAGLKGIASGGKDFCSKVFNYDVNVMAGAGVAPTLEFKPGEGAADLGSNLRGAIDLTPVIEAVQGFPNIDPRALADAVASTLESLDTDQLIGALSQVRPLPLKIAFNRIAGVRANVNGGSDKLLKGGVKLSAVWSDYGDPVDLSDMTVADFADRVLNGAAGLADTADSIVAITGEAYQELDAMF
jgi:hypothetical protein